MANTYHLTFAYLSKNQISQSIRIHTAIKVEYKGFAFYKKLPKIENKNVYNLIGLDLQTFLPAIKISH